MLFSGNPKTLREVLGERKHFWREFGECTPCHPMTGIRASFKASPKQVKPSRRLFGHVGIGDI